MNVAHVVITPDYARQLLEQNTNNRPCSESHVNFLAREIILNRWKLNGSTIVLNGERLIDGQHRLHATAFDEDRADGVKVAGQVLAQGECGFDRGMRAAAAGPGLEAEVFDVPVLSEAIEQGHGVVLKIGRAHV